MSTILKDILNVLIRKLDPNDEVSTDEISVDIMSYNQELNFLYLKSNDDLDSFFKPKDKIELKLVRHDGVYYFDSSIIKIDEIAKQICITSPKKCKKMNRRKSPRHKFETELTIKGAENDKYGITFDISEGGIGFYSKEFFYTDDILFINFYSNLERKKYQIEVTVKDLFIGDDGYIKYGVQFAEWVDDEFKQLVKYLKKREDHKLHIEQINSEKKSKDDSEFKGSFFNKFIFQKK